MQLMEVFELKIGDGHNSRQLLFDFLPSKEQALEALDRSFRFETERALGKLYKDILEGAENPWFTAPNGPTRANNHGWVSFRSRNVYSTKKEYEVRKTVSNNIRNLRSSSLMVEQTKEAKRLLRGAAAALNRASYEASQREELDRVSTRSSKTVLAVIRNQE